MNILMSINLFAITALFGSVSSYFEKCISERCFTLSGSNETKNFNEAKNWCKERKSTLAVVKDNSTQEALIAFFNSVQLRELPKLSIFIDLQRMKKGDTWNLLNGNDYLGGIWLQDANQYYYYSCLQNRSNIFYMDGSKPTSLRNFICEYEATKCSNNSTNNNIEKGECYVKYENESLTWFQARERCRNTGGELATFNYGTPSTSNNEPPINTSWLNTALSYWVGIRLNDCRWISSDDGNETIYTWWSSAEPNNTAYSCVCVDPDGIPAFSWTDCDCQVQSQFICLKIVPTTTATTVSTTTVTTTSTTTKIPSAISANSSTANPALAIGLGAGIGGGVFIILLIVIIVVAVTFIRKRRRKNSVESPAKVEHTHEAEVEHTREAKKNIELATPNRTEIYAQIVPTTQHPANNDKSQGDIIYSTPLFGQKSSGDLYANAAAASVS